MHAHARTHRLHRLQHLHHLHRLHRPRRRYGVFDRYQCPKLVFLDQRLPDGSDRQVSFDAGVAITAESVRKFLVETLRVPLLAPPADGAAAVKEEL